MRLWLAAAVLGIGLIVWGGFQPDDYLVRVVGVAGPIPYPVGGVATFSLIAVLECLVFTAILRVVPKHSLGLLAAFLLSLVVVVFWGVASMHQPPYYFMHLYWLLLVCAALLCLSLIHGVRRFAGWTLVVFFLLIPLSALAHSDAAGAQSSPEPVLHDFLSALYTNDKPAYLKTVYDPAGAESLLGLQQFTPEQVEAVKQEAAGAQLRQSTAFTFEGGPVPSAPYPTGTKATYMTAFRGANLAIPVVLAADGWRVDVRFWLEMQKMQKEHITEADPRIVAKKFVCYELANNLDKVNSVSLTPVTGDEVGVPNGLPGGDLDQVLSLCYEMPVVRARKGESFLSPSGQRVTQGAREGDEVYVALMGPVELPIVLRKQGAEWKVVPENYFRLLRTASAL